MSWKYACPCGKSFGKLASLALHGRWCALCTDDVRLWAAIDKDYPGGCWQWLGALQRDGYAHFTRDGKTFSLHRYLYERLIGPIPDGLDLLHSCDNRACVYPGHMTPGTHQENMADCKAKRRHTFGERNTSAVLTEEMVRQIRQEFRYFTPRRTNARQIAARLGLRHETVYNAATGRTWKHL
jgi:hypothetical protein